MKKKLKGFTLVECIVAMAIIGVASVMMAQIYSGIAKINRDNAAANRTLNEEMDYVEKQLTEDGDNISCTIMTNYNVSTADAKKKETDDPSKVSVSQNSSVTFSLKVKDSTPSILSGKFSAIDKANDNVEIGVVVYKAKKQADRADKIQYEEDTVRYKFIRPSPDSYE